MGWKRVNDTYGHVAGDELIRAAADCMKNSFNEYGKVYRIGGDEFAVIITRGYKRV
ncbi:MAG: diguanylate cyclase domain-containing protein [Clostridium fessum]